MFHNVSSPSALCSLILGNIEWTPSGTTLVLQRAHACQLVWSCFTLVSPPSFRTHPPSSGFGDCEKMWITSLSPEDAFWVSSLNLGVLPVPWVPGALLVCWDACCFGVSFDLLVDRGLCLQFPLEISAHPPAWIPSSQPSTSHQKFLSPPRYVYSILHYTGTYPGMWHNGQGLGILWSRTEWGFRSQDYLCLNANSTTSNCVNLGKFFRFSGSQLSHL